MERSICCPNRPGLRSKSFKIGQQPCNTSHYRLAFRVRVVPYWNKLPEEIVSASSVAILKTRMDAWWQPLFPEVPLKIPPRNCPTLPLVVYGTIYCFLNQKNKICFYVKRSSCDKVPQNCNADTFCSYLISLLWRHIAIYDIAVS